MLVSFFFYVYGYHRDLHVLTLSFPTRRSSDLGQTLAPRAALRLGDRAGEDHHRRPGAGAEHRLQVDHQRAGLLAGRAGADPGMARLLLLEPQAPLVQELFRRPLALLPSALCRLLELQDGLVDGEALADRKSTLLKPSH